MKNVSSMLVDLAPVRQESLTPKEFLRLSNESPHLIAKSRFVTPTVGRRDFGHFEVTYTVPLLKRLAGT